ncbi:MAG: DUF4147 domain-containing protein [Nanoarchaeota archaeon]
MLIKNYNSLKSTKSRKAALDIINAGLSAIKTDKIISQSVKCRAKILQLTDIEDKIHQYNLTDYNKIHLIGFGKASSFMAKALEKKIKFDSGIIISTVNVQLKNTKIKIIKGTHPMPSLINLKATIKIEELLKGLDKNDLVICLISGGGSSLLCHPKIPLKKYLELIKTGFKSGIDIYKLNKIRKRLSYVKGGKLAKLTKASIVSLIFSDVIGDDLGTIASGPTYGRFFKNVDNILLLNNTVALSAMKKKATSLGLKPTIFSTSISGEASVIGKKLVNTFKVKRTDCLLFAGETTVTIKANGTGGRNLELCMGAIKGLSRLRNTALISIGSDGIDGPTDSAGAIIDSSSLKKTKKLNLDIKHYLTDNNSYPFFKKSGDLVMTDQTGSNIADIGVIVRL